MSQPRRYRTDPALPDVIDAAAGGNASAWETLVERYWRRLFAMARSRGMGEELAEEITQSVFATLAEKLGAGDYREEGRFESWLFRIAMNRVRDAARRRKREPAHDGGASLLGEAAPLGGGAPDGDDLQQLRSALARLDPADRDVVTLRHHADLPFKVIADLLGQPVGTVLARHHRALAKLRDQMTGGTSDASARATDDAAGKAGRT